MWCYLDVHFQDPRVKLAARKWSLNSLTTGDLTKQGAALPSVAVQIKLVIRLSDSITFILTKGTVRRLQVPKSRRYTERS